MAEGSLPYRRSSAPISQRSSSERNNNSVESPDSNMNPNRSGLSLPLSTVPHMAIPIYTAPSRLDVEVGGRVLFQNFIHEELAQAHLPEDAIEINSPPPDAFGDVAHTPNYSGDSTFASRAESPALASTPEGFNNSNFIALGATIRDIADQFAVSHQRSLIREQADQVDLGHINHATFRHMMSELFKNGIDKYCIVALFYFCSDVLIRCVKRELHRLGSKLFFWALEFLVDNVCKWVYDHGGWERVFSNIYNVAMKVSVAVALGIFIVCGIIYVKKNL